MRRAVVTSARLTKLLHKLLVIALYPCSLSDGKTTHRMSQTIHALMTDTEHCGLEQLLFLWIRQSPSSTSCGLLKVEVSTKLNLEQAQ